MFIYSIIHNLFLYYKHVIIESYCLDTCLCSLLLYFTRNIQMFKYILSGITTSLSCVHLSIKVLNIKTWPTLLSLFKYIFLLYCFVFIYCSTCIFNRNKLNSFWKYIYEDVEFRFEMDTRLANFIWRSTVTEHDVASQIFSQRNGYTDVNWPGLLTYIKHKVSA
jgi:hypothetical protein